MKFIWLPLAAIFFTGHNEVVAKVMFSHVSVILYTGGVSEEPPGTRETSSRPRRTPPDQTDPPWTKETPPDQADPPRTKENPPGRENPPAGRTPPGRRLQHTVNERPVHILLECILVMTYFYRTGGGQGPPAPLLSEPIFGHVGSVQK